MKFVIHLFLFLLAWCLFLPLSFINFFLVLFRKNAKGYFLDSAKNVDIFACSEFRTLWNATLIRKGGVKFGRRKDETISKIMAINNRENLLTATGKTLYWIIDTIDRGHFDKIDVST